MSSDAAEESALGAPAQNRDMVIRARGVTKVYRIWNSPAARLQHPLMNAVGAMLPFSRFGIKNPKHTARNLYSDFYALHDVSFEMFKGESIGLIGRNGAGKSTLLQIIAGTLEPTEGVVEISGRVAALLELGSGFNLEFTGRENIILNAALLGLSDEETRSKLDGIIKFAELGDFIDQPVKTYSSGMIMRLAFSVTTAAEPEILIVDEALSVGDFFFGQRCIRRMKELLAAGTSVIFVSHDANLIQNLCNKGLFLKDGHLRYFGDSKTAARLYFQEFGAGEEDAEKPSVGAAHPSRPEVIHSLLDLTLWKPERASPSEAVELLGVGVMNHQGQAGTSIKLGETFEIFVLFKTYGPGGFNPSVVLQNRFGQVVTEASTYLAENTILEGVAGRIYRVSFRIEAALEVGDYTFQVAVRSDDLERPGEVVGAESPWLGPIKIHWDSQDGRLPFVGLFALPYTLLIEKFQEDETETADCSQTEGEDSSDQSDSPGTAEAEGQKC